MTTLLSFPGTIYGVVALLLVLLSGGFFLYGWRQKKLRQKQEDQSKALLQKEMEKHERTACACFQKEKYSVAEYHFFAAADRCAKLGDRKGQLRNQHQAYIAMSRTGCERTLLACQQLRKLVEQMGKELFSDDETLKLAKSNLEKLETFELGKAAEADCEKAGQSFEKGDLHEANRLYVQSYRVAKHTGNHALRVRILQEHSRISAKQGNHAEAAKSLEKAARLAREHCAADDGLPALIEWNLGAYQILRDEEAVRELLKKTRAAFNKRELEQAMELAEQVLTQASQTLKNDHWLRADALNLRACVNLSQGFNLEARADLDCAQQILSEWPDAAPQLSEAIENNLARCRRDMGY